jgi:hypothetical protein
MTYLMWRLHRGQLGIAVGCLAALTIALIAIPSRDNHVIEVIVYATIGVPLLLGLFWGAPLLANEFEDGTNGLAWTQGITRRRWLNSNVMWTIFAGALWGAAVTAVVTWWSLSEVSLGRSRLGPGPFDVQGIVPVAYAVFAVVLGIAVGSVVRRVVPAMATTFAAFVAVRIVIAVLVRPHFMSPVSKLVSLDRATGGLPAGAWLLSNPSPHGSHILLTYQPADRFWVFQGVEAGVFIVLAAGLLAVAYRIVINRDA